LIPAPPTTPSEEGAAALRAAHEALAQGNTAEVKSQARLAMKLLPDSEKPWLYLAATSESKASLAYLARAFEINPLSMATKRAIR